MSAMTDGRNAGKTPVERQYSCNIGLCEGTHVMTTEGNLPVEYLCEGDMIVTRSGARALRRITAKPLKDQPVLVLRSALGRGRPARDMYLAPEQEVHVRDWRGRLLFGSDQRSVPLSRLVDHDLIQWAMQDRDVLTYELEFLTQQVIYAEGMEVMSTGTPLRLVQGMAAA